MQVSLSTFADFLAPGERVRAVRDGWQQHGKPYDPGPAQADLKVEHALVRWVAASRPGPDVFRSGWNHEVIGTVVRQLSALPLLDVKVSVLTTTLLDLEISLRPVLEATLGGRRVMIYVYLGPRPAAPETIRGAIGLIEHGQRQIRQHRPAAVLDVPGGGLLRRSPEPLEVGELEQAASRFRAMVGRFGGLADKANIYSYLPPGTDIPEWDLRQLDWNGVQHVLDAGCGSGRHLARLGSVTMAKAVGMDPSVGAVTKARADSTAPGAQVVAGRLERLPFASRRFDVVLAMQMLYNVLDLDRGLAEIHRALNPRGRLLAATNSSRNIAELDELFGEAVHRVTGRAWAGAATEPVQGRFTVENGAAQLRRYFATVEVRRFEQALPIAGVEAIVGHLRDTRMWRGDRTLDAVAWDQVIKVAGEIAANRIACDGSFATTIRQGVFVCADPLGAD